MPLVNGAQASTAPAGTRDGAAALLAAGLEVITLVGYSAASIRDIARQAGMSTANLYHHFSSKEELLFRLMEDGIDLLLADTERVLAAAGDDPLARLRAIIVEHTITHANRDAVAHVSAAEIRFLTSEHEQVMRDKMSRQQRNWDDVVLHGVERGVFSVPRPRDSARALASMCTAVSTWYRKDGPMSPEDVAEHYVQLGQAMLGAAR